jgi:catechol 2,3-dioxygenase-like lactoylglutathione lyase family enzyme
MPLSRQRWTIGATLTALGLVFAFGERAVLAGPPAAGPFRPRATVDAKRAPSSPQALVAAVTKVEVVVRDLARSREFFELLGFEVVREHQLDDADGALRSAVPGARIRRLELGLGNERLALLEFQAGAEPGRPVPRDTRGNDLWFQHVALVVSDMDRAYAWLRAHRVAHVSTGPQTLPAWNRAAGGIKAFYFADPDGHTLELIHFPPGKGDPRWQAPARCRRTPVELCLFLGIDHTAVTVEDTDASLALYRDRLGFVVAGESENYGTEQEHLNGVFGARLRITALRASRGPGVELLEYLAPRGGRPMPADARTNDLVHWQIVTETSDVTPVVAAIVASGGRHVADGKAGRESLVRDRDGHALLVRAAGTR